MIASFQPEVVSLWHMGSLSLNLIPAAAELALPLVFVIGDDWLVYGAWADGCDGPSRGAGTGARSRYWSSVN